MFAVKGWSVSADKLKPEVAIAPATGSSVSRSKKRKRPARPEVVTSANVADLWGQVIEQHKRPGPQNGKPQAEEGEKEPSKRQNLDMAGGPAREPNDGAEKTQKQTPSKMDQEPAIQDRRKHKKSKRTFSDQGNASAAQPEAKQASHSKPRLPSSESAASPKLTPLQASMREKLISARFRHLNETLYTRPSADAYQLFRDSPEMFQEYHEGFRRQVNVWPENPVSGYIQDIKHRGRQRFARRDNKSQKKPFQSTSQGAAQVQPLPRNRATGICTIADLGCGDAALAAALQPDKKKLRLGVLSYDLCSPGPLVTKADIANLPLADGAVDVAILCLALMGTNWIDFVEEAYRVLRWKGELWVAEIKSRFGHVGAAGGGGSGSGRRGPVEHSVGHRRKPGAAAAVGRQGAKDLGAAINETALLIEVDGADDTRQQTDVSAFVAALRKRGFVPQANDESIIDATDSQALAAAGAVDLSNKMFVKMRFLKSAPAMKGKCAQDVQEHFLVNGVGSRKPKFMDKDDAEVDEATLLKPCVYKLR